MKKETIINNLFDLSNQIETKKSELKNLQDKQKELLNFITENLIEFENFLTYKKINKLNITDKDLLINSLIKNNKLFLREKTIFEVEAVQLKNAITNDKKTTNLINFSTQLKTYLLNNCVEILTEKISVTDGKNEFPILEK